MYVPRFNALDDESELRALVADVATAQLITVAEDGYPLASLLPIIWRDDVVIAHMARANEHWKQIGGDVPALLVCTAPQAYISPAWYAAKAEHGKVVPTWNYSVVQLAGVARIHDDPEWVRSMVTSLTEKHEGGRPEPWAVTDAPADYIDGMLKAIVGIEVEVQRVEGKAKLSQNRSEADQRGVVAGLRAEGGPDAQLVADAMVALRSS